MVGVHVPALEAMEDAVRPNQTDGDTGGSGGITEESLSLFPKVDEDFNDTAVNKHSKVYVSTNIVFGEGETVRSETMRGYRMQANKNV